MKISIRTQLISLLFITLSAVITFLIMSYGALGDRILFYICGFIILGLPIALYAISINYIDRTAYWLDKSLSEDQTSMSRFETIEDLNNAGTRIHEITKRFPESNEALSIIKSMTEGLLVVTPEGNIKRANKAMKQMLGYSERELIGRPFTDIYVKLKSLHVQGFFKRKETFREEELFKTRNGKIIPVRFSSSFLFDRDMEVMGFVCIAKDITKEKQAEEELQKQNEWFKVTLASIGEAVITTNNEGSITFMNDIAERLTGWNLDDAIEKSINQVLQVIDHNTRRQVLMTSVKDLSENRAARRPVEQILIRKDGGEIFIDKTAAPIKGSSDELHGAVVVFRDMTELYNAADELRAAKEKAEAAVMAKDMFLANLSHEIRTPMNGVIGMIGLLLDTSLNKEQKEAAELVRRSADALLGLINDILDFSKIEAGKLELEVTEFDPRACVEEVGDLLAQKAHEKGLETPMLLHPNLPDKLEGDPGRLRQVLLNLLNNAIKFTTAGEVYVDVRPDEIDKDSLAKEGEMLLRFEITDTGIGIPQSKMDRLFKPFSQVDPSMSRRFGGTGLGLAICKQLVEVMGGFIKVESEPSVGTSFIFKLPFRKVKDHDVSIPPTPGLENTKTLIADAHETNRYVIRCLLEYNGCQVDEAETGADTLSMLGDMKAKGEPYKMVFVDYGLMDMDARTLTSRIKQEFPETTTVVLATLPHRKSAAQLADVSGYVSKPVKQKRLQEVIGVITGAPAETPPPADAEDQLDLTLDLPARESFKILVVEDNPVNQKVAARLLEKQGYRCDIVGNGLEALEAYSRINYDLILMDCQMPEMDGFEATRRIRMREEGLDKRTPIVAMTANAMKGDRERCLAVGMDNYLAKPVRREELYDVLQAYLG